MCISTLYADGFKTMPTLCTERIALTDDVCVVFDETRTTR